MPETRGPRPRRGRVGARAGSYSLLRPCALLSLLSLVVTSEAAAASVKLFWWEFPLTDCGYDDLKTTCTGQSVAGCEALCAADPLCGGFNFPHGIMKQLSCDTKRATSTGTLYLKKLTPQPPHPPPPPPQSPLVEYEAINVWPMPTSVQLCGKYGGGTCLGPHIVDWTKAGVTLQSCSKEITALVGEVLTLGTVFRAPTRTYDEGPYDKPDSYCTKRCSTDAECGAGSCYVPSDRRWSTKQACSPSSAFNAPCGCCVAGARTTEASALPTIDTLVVSCATPAANKTEPHSNESYSLSITAAGVRIDAPTSKGAAYALTTLAQLLRHDDGVAGMAGDGKVVDFVPLHIADRPLYAWRGFMLDTSRHFVPVADILPMLDTMYAAKLNVFHWHVVDSPSYPLSSESYPELAQEGSWTRSNASIYTKEQLDTVMTRARERFIEVVMEIDTPAHTLAIAKAHPEMMAQCWEWMATARYKVDVDSDDCMALDPTNPATRKMVATLLAEAAALAQTEGGYVHIGGDEVKFPCWRSDLHIADHITKTYGDTSDESCARLQAEWTANVTAAAVVKAGKRPVLWQPTTKGPGDPAWDGALPSSAIYMIWLNAASAKSYAQHDSDVVYTTPFYVAGMGANGWNHVYNADIMPSGLTPEQQAHVLGAEVCMWGETQGAGNLGVRALQIGMGAAENFWREHARGVPTAGSAKGLGTADRYNRFLCHIMRYGVDAPPVMPSHCSSVTPLH